MPPVESAIKISFILVNQLHWQNMVHMVQVLKPVRKSKGLFIDPDLCNLYFKFHESISYQAKVSSFRSQQFM